MSDILEVAQHDPTRKVHVFIVEPEQTVALTLKTILEAEGFEAKAFTDPAEGLRAVLSENPNVVIAAAIMPKVNGIELAIQAKRDCPNCKVILWSGMPEAAVLQEEALAQGYSFEIIPKPIHPSVLLRKIREVV